MDSVLVFVDRMTKMSHFIACLKTTSAPDFARLFVAHIIRLHGLPDSIVSDRGSIFTSNFWSTLASILQINARKSTAFHPQTDGQTERMNQTLETYLRIFVNQEQDDWFDLLPLAEFAYNNARQESTRMSPFFANYDYHPRFLAEFSPTPIPATNDFASHLHDVHDRLVENVKRAQDIQARYYDRKHKPVEFKPTILLGLATMEVGLGLGFRVFIVTFHAGFDGFLFISLALAVAEAIVDFDRSRFNVDFAIEPDWSP